MGVGKTAVAAMAVVVAVGYGAVAVMAGTAVGAGTDVAVGSAALASVRNWARSALATRVSRRSRLLRLSSSSPEPGRQAMPRARTNITIAESNANGFINVSTSYWTEAQVRMRRYYRVRGG